MVTVEVLPGLYLIQECGPDRTGFAQSRNRFPVDWYREGREVHIPQNAYLFVGDETLLFDTLSPAARHWVVDAVDEVLEGRPLDYLVVSHPDVPHAGNAHRILRAHPDCTLVAPAVGVDHELYHLDDARKVGPGDGLDLGGHQVVFQEASFVDAPIHIWMMEQSTRTLLPVDWLGLPHMDGECGRFTDELGLDEDEWVSRLIEFHGRVMFWYEYVDVQKVHAEIDRIVRELDPRHLAPAHGLFVRREPKRFLEWMKPVVEAIVEHGSVGTLG